VTDVRGWPVSVNHTHSADTCGVGQCGTLNRMKEKLHWGDVPFSIWGVVRIAALILIEIVEMFASTLSQGTCLRHGPPARCTDQMAELLRLLLQSSRLSSDHRFLDLRPDTPH